MMDNFKAPYQHTRKKDIGKNRNSSKRFDNALLGLVLGIVFPLLALVVMYFFRFGDYSMSKYFSMFVDLKNPYLLNEASKVVSLSMIANLIPFYFFLNRKFYQTTKGVIIASFFYVILILMYKFVWQ